jgi:environmental stress-induced protein Ves
MNWQHIALADATPLPWKNGGGTTRELLAWPLGAAQWHWRMSVAQVDADGPFSVFEGVQRWFAVLDGAGVELALGQGGAVHMQRLSSKSEAFCFEGALPVDCSLLDGPTQDFNLMVRSAYARAQMQRVQGTLAVSAPDGAVCALWAGASGALLRDTNGVNSNGAYSVPAQTLVWTSAAPAQGLHIDSADALYMEIVPCL